MSTSEVRCPPQTLEGNICVMPIQPPDNMQRCRHLQGALYAGWFILSWCTHFLWSR